MTLVIPLWIGIAFWGTELAILGVLLYFAIRVRPHDIHKLEDESLKTLREIRDEFKRFEERMLYQMRYQVEKHEHEFHGRPAPILPDMPPNGSVE
jgi:hypothetical protein